MELISAHAYQKVACCSMLSDVRARIEAYGFCSDWMCAARRRRERGTSMRGLFAEPAFAALLCRAVRLLSRFAVHSAHSRPKSDCRARHQGQGGGWQSCNKERIPRCSRERGCATHRARHDVDVRCAKRVTTSIPADTIQHRFPSHLHADAQELNTQIQTRGHI